MRLLLQKSEWYLSGAFSLLIVALWLLLILGSLNQKPEASVQQPSKASFGLALPTVISPIMRQEVRSQDTEKVQADSRSLRLPDLQSLLLEF